jgi:hypothetical protein
MSFSTYLCIYACICIYSCFLLPVLPHMALLPLGSLVFILQPHLFSVLFTASLSISQLPFMHAYIPCILMHSLYIYVSIADLLQVFSSLIYYMHFFICLIHVYVYRSISMHICLIFSHNYAFTCIYAFLIYSISSLTFSYLCIFLYLCTFMHLYISMHIPFFMHNYNSYLFLKIFMPVCISALYRLDLCLCILPHACS